MTVDPKRHDDNENPRRQTGGVENASKALPPTLFALPNLSEGDPCPVGDKNAVGNESPAACESTAEGENTSRGETKRPSEPLTEEPLPVADETPVVFEQIPDQPTESVPETTTFGSKEKLLDIWGSRSTVIGLLVLAVTLALIAARKAGEHSQQPTVAQDEAEPWMLEDYVISEGVAISETENDAPSDADAMVAAVESSADGETPAASEMELAASTVGPTAVLSAPVVERSAVETSAAESSVNESSTNESASTIPGEPPVDTVAIAKNDATFAPAERVSATTASSRSDTGESLAETPRENKFAMATDAPAETIGTQAEAPQAREQPSTTVDMPTREIANKPATSESVHFSETPNGISDLIRFLPPLPNSADNTTPTP